MTLDRSDLNSIESIIRENNNRVFAKVEQSEKDVIRVLNDRIRDLEIKIAKLEKSTGREFDTHLKQDNKSTESILEKFFGKKDNKKKSKFWIL